MVSSSFHSLYAQGFCRIGAGRHEIHLGEPAENGARIAALMEEAHQKHAALTVFPELSLTGYSLDDLFFQNTLLKDTIEALRTLVEASVKWRTVGIVGLPICFNQTLYNCAAIFHRGKICGIVPKTNILAEGEFYEGRYFASGNQISNQKISLFGEEILFGTDLLFQAEDLAHFCFGVEICEDLWVPAPPSAELVKAGALLIANLSASPALLGRQKERAFLCASHSRRLMAGYAYAASGWGESTNDLLWDGHLMIYEAGHELGSSISLLPNTDSLLLRDMDFQSLEARRLRSSYFRHINRPESQKPFRKISFKLSPSFEDLDLIRDVEPFPFHLPKEDVACGSFEILNYQAAALAKRLEASHAEKMILGVSGGLDSALALLVCCRAAEILNWPTAHIIACALKGYGTSEESEDLGEGLIKALGVHLKKIDIRPICQHFFKSLGHPAASLPLEQDLFSQKTLAGESYFDLTFENVQAGLRTDLLFRLAGQEKGIVIGTGDLSELALGWCTYGVGDQMAHYNVNAGLPKTLIQQLVSEFSKSDSTIYSAPAREILKKIAERPISPELLPLQKDRSPQKTEQTIGPYSLQDFILFYVLTQGSAPERIAFLLEKAWGKAYDIAEILKWLESFGKRFFNFSQFKRTAMPNGPKILPHIGLSPRGDWRAPSDLTAQLWTKKIQRLKKSFKKS